VASTPFLLFYRFYESCLSLSNLLGIAFRITFVFLVVSRMAFMAGFRFRL